MVKLQKKSTGASVTVRMNSMKAGSKGKSASTTIRVELKSTAKQVLAFVMKGQNKQAEQGQTGATITIRMNSMKAGSKNKSASQAIYVGSKATAKKVLAGIMKGLK